MPTLSGVDLVAPPIDGIADDRASVERTRAFVKVQDGCSFYCTYCIIPRARGAERSLAPEAVLADVRRAIAAGHREIVLTGINIGTYDGGWSERGPRGAHARAALTLAGLVRRILAETDVERIRLSSIEPQHVDDELLGAWVDGAPRTLPHLHLPLQSGDDGVLRRMGRRYLTADYAAVVERARAAIPGVAVHADVIAGFPTEDDAAFARTLAFVRGLDFAGLHVFRYSARPGTPATRMAGQVDERTKKARAGELLAVAADARAAFARQGLGTVTRVLAETRLPDGRWVGHAEDHVLVAVNARHGDPEDLENAILTVRRTAIDGETADRTTGEILAIDLPRVRCGPRCPCSPLEQSMPADCLFCRIAAGEIPSTKLHEDAQVLAIRDINPQAPTHVLVIPVAHVASAADLTDADGPLLGRLFAVAADIARSEGLDGGWRLVTNVGPDGGQSVDHLHLHLLGGRRMTWPPG